MSNLIGIVIILGSVALGLIPAIMSLRAAVMFKRFDHRRITYWWDRLFPIGMAGFLLGFVVLEGIHAQTDIFDVLIVTGGLILLIGLNLLFVGRSLRRLSGIYALRERKLAVQRRRGQALR